MLNAFKSLMYNHDKRTRQRPYDQEVSQTQPCSAVAASTIGWEHILQEPET